MATPGARRGGREDRNANVPPPNEPLTNERAVACDKELEVIVIDKSRRRSEPPGSPWKNGCVESFNGNLRDELLSGEILDTLKEAKVIIEMWRKRHNNVRPHRSLGYRPPAPGTIAAGPPSAALWSAQQRGGGPVLGLS
jgi:transposase InsO family protein